jgi:hypothetical protein
MLALCELTVSLKGTRGVLLLFFGSMQSYPFLSADSVPTDSLPTDEGLILSFKACQTASRQPPDSLLSLQISHNICPHNERRRMDPSLMTTILFRVCRLV